MISPLDLPPLDDPHVEHVEIMRLVLSMGNGAVKTSVRPIVCSSEEGVSGQVGFFGTCMADAVRCYAEAVATQHGIDPEQAIRCVVDALQQELADSTGGDLEIEVRGE